MMVCQSVYGTRSVLVNPPSLLLFFPSVSTFSLSPISTYCTVFGCGETMHIVFILLAVPSQPLSLQLTSNIDAAVWDPPSSPNGEIVDYVIMIYRNGSSTGSNRQTNRKPHYVIDKDNDVPSGVGDVCVKVSNCNPNCYF